MRQNEISGKKTGRKNGGKITAKVPQKIPTANSPLLFPVIFTQNPRLIFSRWYAKLLIHMGITGVPRKPAIFQSLLCVHACVCLHVRVTYTVPVPIVISSG